LQHPRILLSRLWEALPETTRRQTLRTLAQLVARHLAAPRERKEVSHEDR